MGDDEAARRSIDVDYGRPLTKEYLDAGRHRVRVGGRWELLGQLQLDFMLSQGLQPQDRLLDVGCGALRAGTHFVDYLDPGRYYGIDINPSLLEAGYDRELSDEQRAKLPREQLRATDRFDCDFGVPFTYAIAQSLFTHVSLNHIRLCLYRLAKVMPPGGRFFATFYEVPRSHPLDQPRGSGYHWTERNGFFYYRSDLRWAATHSPWETHYIGAWGHPRGQRMMEFRRKAPTPDSANRPPSRLARVRRAARRVPRSITGSQARRT